MSGKRLKAGGQSCNTPPIYDEMALKCFIYVSNKQIECLEQFQRRNSEEKKEMSVKATWKYCPSSKSRWSILQYYEYTPYI